MKSLYSRLHQLLLKVLPGISIAIEYVITEQKFSGQVNLQTEKYHTVNSSIQIQMIIGNPVKFLTRYEVSGDLKLHFTSSSCIGLMVFKI